MAFPSSVTGFARATFPIPFVPSGHFPLTRGIGPLEGGRLRDVGSESFRHGLRSPWQLCCLTDAAYPLRVLRSSECQKGFIDR